jgi:hypothetical protein
VKVAGTGVFVAGGGSVLTCIPLSDSGVSVGTGVGVPAIGAELQAANAIAAMISPIRLIQILFMV